MLKTGFELEFQVCNKRNADMIFDPDYRPWPLLDKRIPGLEIVMDNSVRGGEIRPAKPLALSTALKKCRRLFAENVFEIDIWCSFHIHLSRGRESYSKRRQHVMTEYLITNIARVPPAVRERWYSEARFEYFDLDVSRDKNVFVNYSAHYNSWEFRAFGNVSNYEDARACYKLAVEAFEYSAPNNVRPKLLMCELDIMLGNAKIADEIVAPLLATTSGLLRSA